MTDKLSPALGYQEFMRNAEAFWQARGFKLLPEEYTVLHNAVLIPAAWSMPVLSDTERLTALRDKRDILQAQLFQVEDAIEALENKLEHDNVSVMDR